MERHGCKFEMLTASAQEAAKPSANAVDTANTGCFGSTVDPASGRGITSKICRIQGRLQPGEYRLAGNISSQFITGLLFALPLGLLVSLGSMSRFTPLRGVVKTFVWIIRGTPLMLQILVIYLGPGLMGFTNPWPSGSSGRLVAAVVAFAINYACYFSEIYRGGIEAVPKGQTEAGQVLGMTKSQIFFKVTLLQVVKRILPPMGNEVITLVKDTSLANVIANKEIIMMAKEYSAKGLIWPLFSTALFFLVFVGALTLLLDWAEKKMDYFRC